jgi:hypothetical protein
VKILEASPAKRQNHSTAHLYLVGAPKIYGFFKKLRKFSEYGGKCFKKSDSPALVFRNCGGQIQVGAVEQCGRLAGEPF